MQLVEQEQQDGIGLFGLIKKQDNIALMQNY